MKKFKLGVLAMALVSMLGFTSCLDSGETSNTRTFTGPLRVSNFMGLYTLYTPFGGVLTPLNPELLEGVNDYSQYTWAFYSVDYDTQDENAAELDVTVLSYFYVRDGIVAEIAPAEESKLAPVRDVNFDEFAYNNDARGMFYGVSDLFVPIYYYMRNVDTDDKDETNAELAKHQFTLSYNPSEDFNASTITLHLTHVVSDLEEGGTFTQSTGNIQHFNLASPLETYEQTYNTNPSRIVISFEQNSTNNDYENANEQEFSFDYQAVVDYYETWENSNGSNE